MGLDMYLYRYPRFKGYGPEQMNVVSEYVDWLNDPKAKEETFYSWSGHDESELPPKEDLEYLKGFAGKRYYAWDDRKRHPYCAISEQVGYWRKANAIHNWFVHRVQDGEDDCEYHDEVTKEVLEELKGRCEAVLREAILVSGKVKNGYRLGKNGQEIPIMEDGKFVFNPDICDEMLPSRDGFFFGSTDYDQWYINDIKYTYELCGELLESTDFDNQMIFYVSSW